MTQMEPPAWITAALDALEQFKAQHGHPPAEAVLSTRALHQLREYNAGIRPTEFLFGYPIVRSGDIDGIYFR